VPAVIPVTTPPALTLALGLVVLQTPPGVASASVIVAVGQTVDEPVIGATVRGALTVTTRLVTPVRQVVDEA